MVIWQLTDILGGELSVQTFLELLNIICVPSDNKTIDVSNDHHIHNVAISFLNQPRDTRIRETLFGTEAPWLRRQE